MAQADAPSYHSAKKKKKTNPQFPARFMLDSKSKVLPLHHGNRISPTGTRTPVERVKAAYPDQLDYRGIAHDRRSHTFVINTFFLPFERTSSNVPIENLDLKYQCLTSRLSPHSPALARGAKYVKSASSSARRCANATAYFARHTSSIPNILAHSTTSASSGSYFAPKTLSSFQKS